MFLINNIDMKGIHKCKEFNATEEYFLNGEVDDGVLYIKTTGGSDGIINIRCVECNKEISSDIKVEVC